MDAAKHLSAPVIYPETDDMGEHETQFKIAQLLVPLLVTLLARQERVARVSGNQFWYFAKGQPRRCRAPDVYVVDGIAPTEPDRASWFTWEGDRPAFALEVVSTKWQKDYDEAPGEASSPAIRVLCPAEAISHLRDQIREGTVPEVLLDAQVLTPAALAALRSSPRDVARFVEIREREVTV